MPPAARKTPAKKTAAKKSTAKKSTAKKSTAKKSTAKKSTAKKSTAKKSTARKTTPKAASSSASFASAQAAANAAASSAQAGVDDAVARINELQARLLETARRGGDAYLLAYERNLTSMLELTASAAESTQLNWAITLANNYADFVKRVNDAFLKAGRQALH